MEKYLYVLEYIDRKHPTLQSDFARYNAKLISEACSRGHISNITFGMVTNNWRLTFKGYTLCKNADKNFTKSLVYPKYAD